MLDKLFGYKIHSILHVLGMCILAFGLPFNKVLMSIGAIWGVSNLVLEGNFKFYYQNLSSNKIFLGIFSFFLLHILGIFWSDDISFALHDILIKLPLLAVPLALIARPLRNRFEHHFVLYALLLSLLFTSILNFGFYNQWFGVKVYSDIRQMSLFGSHIRYGILIALASAICLYFLIQKKSDIPKLVFTLILLWFTIYTFYSQVLSGTLSYLVILFLFIVITTYKLNKFIPWVLGGIILIAGMGLITFLIPNKVNDIPRSKLPKYTKEGNLYLNDFKSKNRESNQLVYISYCDLELEREWNKMSTISYYTKDLKGQLIRNTLIRYLTSKKLTKDAEGIRKLTRQDVSNIENGIASIDLLKTGIMARLYGIKYQFNNDFDPNGHSILQRLVYWKTGWEIIKDNWLIGTGTGDTQKAFDNQYVKDESILLPQNRLRAHNMYLTVWITFGIVGLIVFIGFLISFIRLNIQSNELVGILFFGVLITTFLIEDTIETQMGVCMVSLFVGLFSTRIEKN